MDHTTTDISTQTTATVLEEALFEAKRVLVGQDVMIERLFVCWLARGHCLLEGAPGLAKTLAAETVARILGGDFHRVQFTPDLVPADLVGTRVYRPSSEEFTTELGPVFTNVLLADEINRAPAKVQSALLEVMAEHHVSIGGTTHPVPDPFMVLATQNPIESEGTYPLPEAQLDRFLLKVTVGYPSRTEEKEVLLRMSSGGPIPVRRLVEPETILEAREAIGKVHLDPRLVDYIVDLVRATREPAEVGLGGLAPLIAFGASPRASIALAQASRAHAWLRGRDYVAPDDIQALAPDVFRHRLVLTFEAEAEDATADTVIHQVLNAVSAP
jgi:MoxR-like ATPase